MRGLTLAFYMLVLSLASVAVTAAQSSTPAPALNLTVNSTASPTRPNEEAPVPAPATRDGRYRLCPTDAIALTFPLTPEFDQTLNIQPDGYASLAGAGSVHLAGLTTRESADVVRAAYAKILHDPIVTVELKDFNKPYFVVAGQVNRPGKYDLRGDMSATEAVAIAGGFTEAARHSQVLLFRRVNDGRYEVKPLNLKRILHGADVNEDVEIRSGDTLYVPQNTFSKLKRFIPSSGFGAYYQLNP